MDGMSAKASAPASIVPPQSDPREHAVSQALERARASRIELQELRLRREAAGKRADAAIRALREPNEKVEKNDRVQDALDTIERVTRIPTPGNK